MRSLRLVGRKYQYLELDLHWRAVSPVLELDVEISDVSDRPTQEEKPQKRGFSPVALDHSVRQPGERAKKTGEILIRGEISPSSSAPSSWLDGLSHQMPRSLIH